MISALKKGFRPRAENNRLVEISLKTVIGHTMYNILASKMEKIKNSVEFSHKRKYFQPTSRRTSAIQRDSFSLRIREKD